MEYQIQAVYGNDGWTGEPSKKMSLKTLRDVPPKEDKKEAKNSNKTTPRSPLKNRIWMQKIRRLKLHG